ncbi:MAG TPA: hypothetical protein VJ343_02215 [archaeon]|nr:hypothetical protein [archaeon]
MRKAQSLIIQFVIFFMMGFVLFLGVGTFFKMQSDIFRDEIANSAVNLTGSYFSSAAVSAVDSCKQCDYVQYSLKIENFTADYVLEVKLDNLDELSVRAIPGGGRSVFDLHNFNESLNLLGSAPSVRPINLTFNRTKNELRVG